MKTTECPDYDGVPTVGGPCWTCMGGLGPCPLLDAERAQERRRAAVGLLVLSFLVAAALALPWALWSAYQ